MADLNAAAPIWLLGCGNMGGAMLRGWLAAGLDPASVTIIDPVLDSAPQGVRLVRSIPVGEPAPRTLVLAIKPQQLAAAAPELARAISAETMLVSILAGTEIDSLIRLTGAAVIVRAMPNTPAAIGRGITALHARGADVARCSVAEQLVAALGAVEWIDAEAQFDAVTALSGSGPAFVFRFIDAMASAGAKLGLDPALAGRLAMATVAGSAALAEASDVDPATLAERVASPGGTTRAGLNVLDEADGITTLIDRTLAAAAKRSAEMAAEARAQG